MVVSPRDLKALGFDGAVAVAAVGGAALLRVEAAHGVAGRRDHGARRFLVGGRVEDGELPF